MKGGVIMEKKRISISAKRQITIPQKFYEMLGFNNEAECIVHGNELIVRPIKETTDGEFDEQILEDLISQGLQGEELLARFKEVRKKVRPAVEAMLREAEQVADGEGKYFTYNDVFGPEEQ